MKPLQSITATRSGRCQWATPCNCRKPAYSCIRCSDRKVKCDRQNPCSACAKHNAKCTFRPLPQPQKPRKGARKDALSGRLQHSELENTQRGPHLSPASQSEGTRSDKSRQDDTPQTHSDPKLLTPSSAASEPIPPLSSLRASSHHEMSNYVDNGLMTRVAEEFHDTKESSHEFSHEESDGMELEDMYDLVMGTPSGRHNRYKHPPATQINELWQVFAANVDPITKIVHAPSLQPAITKAVGNIPSVSKSLSALLFAIYSTAILSLRESECQARFTQPRDSLLSYYISATKVALARADFTSSTNIVVLQALILHIVSIRDTQHPRSVWTLTGVAMRIAEGIGLNRNAQSSRLAPHEVQTRYLIWYFLKMHDNRAAEMCGQPKFQGLDADFDIDTSMTPLGSGETYHGAPSPLSEASRPTEMIFCAVQVECFAFARRMVAMNRKDRRQIAFADDFASEQSTMPNEDVIQSMEDHIETQYLRYCDPSDPLQLVTVLFARYCINVSRFMAHHPRKWKSREHMPESERQFVWDVSLKLMEQFEMIQSSRHIQRFAWNFAYYLQWWAFIHILDTLRADPLNSDTTKAWRLVETTFQNNPLIMANTKRSLYLAVGNLCLKAFSAYETALARGQSSMPLVPDFIQQLRQQREAIKARAEIRTSLLKEREASSFDAQTTKHPIDTGAMVHQGHIGSPHSSTDSACRSQVPGQGLIPPGTNISTGWVVDDSRGVDSGVATSIPNVSFTLHRDQNMDDASLEDLDWTQWDAWLSGTDFQMTDI